MLNLLNYSQNEIEFFRTLLFDYDIRVDGRNKLTLRDHNLYLEVLPSCLSSLKITYMDNQKEILFAIKGEIVSRDSFRSNDKLISVSLDSMYKIEDVKSKKHIEDLIEELILSKIDKDALRINQNFEDFYWKLYVDIYVFDVIKMSLLQLLMIGVKAALRNISLPRLSVFTNEITGNKEYDLVEVYEDVSELEKEFSLRELIKVPDVFVFAILNNSIFLDPTEEEFSIATTIVIISSYEGKVTNFQSIGSNVDLQLINDISGLIKSL